MHQYSVLGGKTRPNLLPLVDLMAWREEDRLADMMRVGFEILKILNRLNYLVFILFVAVSQQCYYSIRVTFQLAFVK